jgi:C4-dicarboxylate-specific signal transduction histidine kinase
MAFPYYCQARRRLRRVRSLPRLDELVKKYGKLINGEKDEEKLSHLTTKLEKAKTAAANTLRNLGGSRT